MKAFRSTCLAALIILAMMGCGNGNVEQPLPSATFSSQWVKIDSHDYLLVSWTGGGKEQPNMFDYTSAMTAFRYGTSTNSYDGTIYLYSLPTKADNQPTSDVVVDPQRVCAQLSDLKVKAKTAQGWVDVPIAPPPKGMETVWGHVAPK